MERLAVFATFQHVGEHKENLARWSRSTIASRQSPSNFRKPKHGTVHFSRDGKAVIYPIRDHDVENLWLQPLDGSPGKQITNFKSERIRRQLSPGPPTANN